MREIGRERERESQREGNRTRQRMRGVKMREREINVRHE